MTGLVRNTNQILIYLIFLSIGMVLSIKKPYYSPKRKMWSFRDQYELSVLVL